MYAKEMLKQSLPLLIFCGLGGIVAGTVEALILGFIGGWLIAYFYNRFA